MSRTNRGERKKLHKLAGVLVIAVSTGFYLWPGQALAEYQEQEGTTEIPASRKGKIKQGVRLSLGDMKRRIGIYGFMAAVREEHRKRWCCLAAANPWWIFMAVIMMGMERWCRRMSSMWETLMAVLLAGRYMMIPGSFPAIRCLIYMIRHPVA